jgi:hypothetical protein
MIILFLLKKLVGTSILKIELKFMSEDRENPNDPSPPFKKKEEAGVRHPKLGGQRNVPMFGGQCNVPSLVANGRKRRRFFLNSSHFPPNQLYFDLHFFSFDIDVYFTMVLSHYLCISFLFLGL